MPSTYNPNSGNSTETFDFPNPGEEVTADSVRAFGFRIADRLKAVVDTVTATINVATRTLKVTDGGGVGIGIQGISSSGIGLSGQGPVGADGVTSGSTPDDRGLQGRAALGTAVGVYGESVGGYALEAQGKSGGKALLARGHMRFAQAESGGTTQVNPGINFPQTNVICGLNTIKAWGHVVNGALFEGFNVDSVGLAGPSILRVNLGSGFPTPTAYGVFVSSAYLFGSVGTNVQMLTSGANAPGTGYFYLQQFNMNITSQGDLAEFTKGMSESDFTFIVLGRQDVEAS